MSQSSIARDKGFDWGVPGKSPLMALRSITCYGFSNGSMEKTRRVGLWKFQNRGKLMLFSGSILPNCKHFENQVINCLAQLNQWICQKIATKNIAHLCLPMKAGSPYASCGTKGVASLRPELPCRLMRGARLPPLGLLGPPNLGN
jgi:hypothetical protein